MNSSPNIGNDQGYRFRVDGVPDEASMDVYLPAGYYDITDRNNEPIQGATTSTHPDNPADVFVDHGNGVVYAHRDDGLTSY